MWDFFSKSPTNLVLTTVPLSQSSLKPGTMPTKDQGALPLPKTADPSSPLDYLQKGKAYSERGYQRMAIDAYKEGLSKTTASDPVYQQLKQAKKDAEEHDDTHVDFIRISSNILHPDWFLKIIHWNMTSLPSIMHLYSYPKHGVSDLWKWVICTTRTACMDGIQNQN